MHSGIQDAIMRLLDAHPAGVLRSEIEAMLAVPRYAGTYLFRLQTQGKVGYVPEPRYAGKGRPPYRYFAAEHCPPGAVLRPRRELQAQQSAKTRPTLFAPPAAPNANTVMRRKPGAIEHDGQPAIIPGGVRVTVCPSSRDTRYTVSELTEPIFSALGIGRYLIEAER